MSKQFLFLSYKRGPNTTPVIERLFSRITVQLQGREVVPFFDRKSIEAGEPWEAGIDNFIAKTTLFVAFISIDFWLSDQCRRELDLAIHRYEIEKAPKLLFVLADQLDPNDLAFDKEAARKQLGEAVPDEAKLEQVEDAARRVATVRGIGQFNFLGPYDDHSGALVRLMFEDPVKADLQLAQLVESIKQLKVLA